MKTGLSRITCLATVLLIISTVSVGQNYKSDVSKADFALKKGDYEAAAKFYSEAIKTITTLGKSNLEILYKLGFSQMQIKNYSKASVSFAQYINIAKSVSADLSKLKDIIQWKDWCDNEVNDQQGQSIVTNSNIYLTNMRGLNSSLNDLSITLDSKNEIIFFTSNKVYFDDKKLINIKTNLFSSEIQNDALTEPIKIGAEINSLGEIISACLASDNKTLYFTVANDDQTQADIYVCKYKSGKFEKPEKLPKIINSKYFDGYPSISDDGKSLYFVSDRPGGIGGKDIYVTRILPDGTWSEPYNLGKSVNTKYDEITPHIDKSNEILYFSSKGHPGNGGFDIFYSKFNNKGKWGAPVNMVEPINSKSDDIAYITTSDPNIAYFSSSRKGGSGNFDIYKAGKINNNSPVEEKPLIANTNGITKDTTKTNEFDEFKKLTEKVNQSQQVQPAIVSDKSNEKPANVSYKLDTVTEFINNQPNSENHYTSIQPSTTDKTIAKQNNEAPKTDKVTQNTIQPPIQQPQPTNPPPANPSIAKSANESQKTENITKNKIQPLVQKPNINVPINQDTAILNSTIRGLVFRVQLGAFKNHITVNSPYFDKLNRKLIQEELSEEMLYKYTIGNFESVNRGTNAKLVLRESGYTGAFLACYFNGKRVTMDEALKMLDKKVYERIAFYQK